MHKYVCMYLCTSHKFVDIKYLYRSRHLCYLNKDKTKDFLLLFIIKYHFAKNWLSKRRHHAKVSQHDRLVEFVEGLLVRWIIRLLRHYFKIIQCCACIQRSNVISTWNIQTAVQDRWYLIFFMVFFRLP